MNAVDGAHRREVTENDLVGADANDGTISLEESLNGHALLQASDMGGQPEVGDGGIVVGRMLEGLEGIVIAALLGDLAGLELAQELGIVGRIAEDRNAAVVLGGGSDEGYAANVDLLDCICERAAGLRDGGRERVEVANDDRDGRDALRLQILFV